MGLDITLNKYMKFILAEKIENSVLSGSYYSQPKIDGIRMSAENVNGSITLYTRQGNIIQNCREIKEELKSFLPEGMTIDGELFYKNFQTSLSDFQKEGSNLQFIVFDLYNEELKMKPYIKRFKMLQKLVLDRSKVKVIPMNEKPVTANMKHEELNKWVSLGYEGLILRKNAHWEEGRSENLLKMKKFFDEEFICQEVQKTEKSFIAHFLTHEGKPFSTKATESFYKMRKKYIGKPCTVRFQEYSSKGIPRFPRLIICRDYE